MKGSQHAAPFKETEKVYAMKESEETSVEALRNEAE